MTLSSEITGGEEIRIHRNVESLHFRKKRRGKFAATNGLERGVALRGEGIEVTAVPGDDAAAGRAIAHNQILDPIFIEVSRNHGQRLGRAHTGCGWTNVSHRKRPIVLQPNLRSAGVRGPLL